MTPRKLNIQFTFFSYSGNSTGTSEISALREWFTPLAIKLKTDPYYSERIGHILPVTLADTPITMTRNRAVMIARANDIDVLVMVDSDMVPDVHKGDYGAKPFFESSFDFLYDHYDRGPVVIGAPYGGPPPHENMYVFCWSSDMNAGDESPLQLRQYNREEATAMSGIHEAAALPTGLIMYDMRSFKLIEPSHLQKSEVLELLVTGQMTVEEASCALEPGWFRYEWKDQYAYDKASTEDVQNTRDISLAGYETLGYNPVFCNWDAWAGHNKVWTVKKPQKYSIENVSDSLRRAITNRWSIREQVVNLKGSRFRNLPFTKAEPKSNGHASNGHASNGKPKLSKEISVRLNTRKLFGYEVTEYEQMTPTDHLIELHNLVRAEHERRGRKLNIVELGSYVGASSIAMASTGCCENIVCIDNFKGTDKEWQKHIQEALGGPETLEELFIQNTAPFDNIHLVKALSYVAADLCPLDVTFEPYEKADIVFIDADHTYDATKRDIESWLNKVDEDGIIVGHDYRHERYPGVEDAVTDIFGDLAQPFGLMNKYGGFWLVRMREYLDAKAHSA